MTGVITMPRMGETMDSGRVVAWLKKAGERFERGETILEVETDKVTVEVPALDSGELTEILAREGQEVAVGEPLGRYDAGGAAPDLAPSGAQLLDLTMPRMGETMEEGRLAAWLKQPDETFKRGEVLAEVETDKVTVEMPALADGELVEIIAAVGTSVSVGTTIARYRTTGPTPSPVLQAPVTAKAPAPPPSTASAPAAPPLPGRRRATPAARRAARHAGIDLSALAGTGRRGRIELRDVPLPNSGQNAPAMPLAALLPEPRFVTLPQGRMAYREWGPSTAARRTIVVLHGFSADSATWASLADVLARGGARVVVPDLPGHGVTSIEAPDLDAVIEGAAAFVQALGLGGADILAHSMGGAVAARLVATGQQAASLTLVAPAGLGGEIDADFVHGMAGVTAGGALAHLLRRLARRPPVLSRPQLERMAAGFAAGRLRGLAAALAPGGRQGVDIVGDLAACKAPNRILWGLDDRIIPWGQVQGAPSRTAIHLIADAGHMPHWDQPQEVAMLLS